MSDLEFELLLSALSDPDRDDGPELPGAQQCDPDDRGVWLLWEGSPIKAGHDLAAARADRAWARLRERGLRPELGEGLFPEVAAPRTVERVVPAGEWVGAL